MRQYYNSNSVNFWNRPKITPTNPKSKPPNFTANMSGLVEDDDVRATLALQLPENRIPYHPRIRIQFLFSPNDGTPSFFPPRSSPLVPLPPPTIPLTPQSPSPTPPTPFPGISPEWLRERGRGGDREGGSHRPLRHKGRHQIPRGLPYRQPRPHHPRPPHRRRGFRPRFDRYRREHHR